VSSEAPTLNLLLIRIESSQGKEKVIDPKRHRTEEIETDEGPLL